jgi:hypothetical protein
MEPDDTGRSFWSLPRENGPVLPRKRLLIAVAIAAVVALPAGVLAGLCVGNACRRQERAVGRVPFCSLPQDLRSLIAAGFRDGRSPHVLTVTDQDTSGDAADVPIVFAGAGVQRGAELPAGTTLDAVAPTLAEIVDLNRPHPGVRSGEPVVGVASGEAPRLVLLVAWKGVRSGALERAPQRWPVLRGLFEDGAGTLEATPGSLPLDPAALLATIGTGGLPRDHGITGSLVRDDEGNVVAPWSDDEFVSVIATLADDLDELRGQQPRVALIGTEETDRGLVGGNWYVENDLDDIAIERAPDGQALAADAVLASGYGDDTTTDLLAVAMHGSIPQLDRATGRIMASAERMSEGSFAIAIVGAPWTAREDSSRRSPSEIEAELERRLQADVVEAIVGNGIFLDQEAMTASGLSDDRVVAALRGLETPSGERVYLDVFPAIAVTFARYC